MMMPSGSADKTTSSLQRSIVVPVMAKSKLRCTLIFECLVVAPSLFISSQHKVISDAKTCKHGFYFCIHPAHFAQAHADMDSFENYTLHRNQ